MKKNSEGLDSEVNAILEEYKTLRDEILSGQGRRLQTMSLTVGVVGVILSIISAAVLGSEIPTAEARLALSVGGGIALYGILIPSQIMTMHQQQTIQRVGGYIRIFIEPKIRGLHWHNRWNVHKSQYRLPKGLGGIAGIYCFLSFLPLLFPLYIISQRPQNWYLIFVLAPFFCWSLYLSYDIQAARSKGWKWQWKPDGKKAPSQRKAG